MRASLYLAVMLIVCLLCASFTFAEEATAASISSGKEAVDVDTDEHHSDHHSRDSHDSHDSKEHEESWQHQAEEFRELKFVSAFIASASMILVSEVGDKTFFIAAIMAMKHSHREVFAAAISALAVMTVLSAALGYTIPNLLPPELTHLCATLLFLYFGFKLLWDAYNMSSSTANLEELEEVEEELEKLNAEHEGKVEDKASAALEEGSAAAPATENGDSDSSRHTRARGSNNSDSSKSGFVAKYISPMTQKLFSRIFIQTFTMTFLAEWGDRSQIATIALAAAKDPYGVTVGGIVGHCVTTGVAVVGGKMLATSISERSIAYTGGALFLIFGVHSIFYA